MQDSFTLIDLFASEALHAVISTSGFVMGHEATVARQAYAIADAMLQERRTLQIEYYSLARVRARNIRQLAPDLLSAVQMCTQAEKDRQRKLKPGSPAYADAGKRIEHLEGLIVKAMAG